MRKYIIWIWKSFNCDVELNVELILSCLKLSVFQDMNFISIKLYNFNSRCLILISLKIINWTIKFYFIFFDYFFTCIITFCWNLLVKIFKTWFFSKRTEKVKKIVFYFFLIFSQKITLYLYITFYIYLIMSKENVVRSKQVLWWTKYFFENHWWFFK